MARHVSGTFERAVRVTASPGTRVRLVLLARGRELQPTLLELGMSDLLLSAAELPDLGTRVSVAITLENRYLEFEIPGRISWHRNGEFGVSYDYLSPRQTYGLALAIDLMRRASDEAK